MHQTKHTGKYLMNYGLNQSKCDMDVLSQFRENGQAVWLEEVCQTSLRDGSLRSLVDDFGVTGATISPAGLWRAITSGPGYNGVIRDRLQAGVSGNELMQDLLIRDVAHTADILRPVYERTDRVDGWVVMPLSPLLCSQKQSDLQEGTILSQVDRRNVLLSIPGIYKSPERIEKTVVAGHSLALTPICSAAHYRRVAESYFHGIERRIAAGMKSRVPVFAVVPLGSIVRLLSDHIECENAILLSVCIAEEIYKAMEMLNSSRRCQKIFGAGGRPLRIIWETSRLENAPLAGIVLSMLSRPQTIMALPKAAVEILGRPDSTKAELLRVVEDQLDRTRNAKELRTLYRDFEDTLQLEIASEDERVWIQLMDCIAKKSANITQQPIFHGGEQHHASIHGSLRTIPGGRHISGGEFRKG